MGRVDAKKLKNRLTLSQYEDVMKALGVRLFSKSQSQLVYYNATKHKDEASQSPKLYLYTDTKIFTDYTLGSSLDIFGVVQTIKTKHGEHCGFLDALNYVLSVTGIEPDACKRLTTKTVYDWESDLGRYIKIRKGESGLSVYDDKILDELDQTLPEEWLNEGISEDTLIKYKIGHYPRTNAITIPCLNKEGKLIGIRTRNIRPDLVDQAKYIPLTTLAGQCYKFNTNQALYGFNYNWAEIERTGVVMICEGEKSVLKLDTIYGNKSTGVAMYGSNLGLTRMRELLKLGVNKVIYIADNDWQRNNEQAYYDWCDKIQKQVSIWKGYAEVELVYDNLGLLNEKDNALDRDLDIWNKLYESRAKIV